MAAFEYATDDVPEYLESEYGIRVENALNIGKVIRDDLKFEDSRSNIGIQVADLLASGLRRCLRGQFQENQVIATALGRLTLQNQRGKFPIHLVSFTEEGDADPTAVRVVNTLALGQC